MDIRPYFYISILLIKKGGFLNPPLKFRNRVLLTRGGCFGRLGIGYNFL